MQALAERLDDFVSGRALRSIELLGFSSLKTFSPAVEDLYGQVLNPSPAGRSTWCGPSPAGSRIVLHLSQAGRVDVEPAQADPPAGSVARFIFSTDGNPSDGRVESAGRRTPDGRPRP
jgi:hypothetical protein